MYPVVVELVADYGRPTLIRFANGSQYAFAPPMDIAEAGALLQAGTVPA